jgi:hypothetical protein
MKIHFATFASSNYQRTLNRICQEAVDSGFFNGKIFGFTEKDLDPAYYARHARFLHTTRGFGYWLWKSQVILKVFDQIQEGEYVMYLDAGCTINPEGKPRWEEWCKLIAPSQEGILSLSLGDTTPDKFWTKADTAHYMNVQNNSKIMETGQLVGGIFLIRKQPSTIALVQQWNDIMESNYHLIDDSPSIIPDIPGFREYRHDQSLWSILRKLHGSVIIPDNSYPRPTGSSFWATRILN